MNYLKTITQLLIIFLLPVGVVLAQSSAWFDNVSGALVNSVLPTLVILLTALAVLYFVWGLVVFIAQSGNEQARTEGKQKMIWGIIALFVLVSTWGLVYLLQTIVGAGGATTPVAPQTTYTP